MDRLYLTPFVSTGTTRTATFGAFYTLLCFEIRADSYNSFPYGTAQQGNNLVLIHDAFQPLSYWSGFMQPPNWQGVAIDTHIYQMFSQDVSIDPPRVHVRVLSLRP